MIKATMIGVGLGVSAIGGTGVTGVAVALASEDCCAWLWNVCCGLGLGCC
jgi:hypothetical protein